jgi:hypothetical protein
MKNIRSPLLAAALAMSLAGGAALIPNDAATRPSEPLAPKQRGTVNRKRPMHKINRRKALKGA